MRTEVSTYILDARIANVIKTIGGYVVERYEHGTKNTTEMAFYTEQDAENFAEDWVMKHE